MISRAEAWLQHVSTLLVGGTGIIYLLFRYFIKSPDPFALVHPYQGHAQHAHIVVAPLLVFAAGLIWRRHVADRMRAGRRDRRLSGVGLALTLAPMVASGYLIQISLEPRWRLLWVGVHLATSAIWLLMYTVHQIVRRITTDDGQQRSALPQALVGRKAEG